MTRDEIEKAIKDFEMPSDAYYSDFDSVNPKTLIAFAEHILRVAEAKQWQPIETAPKETLVDCWYVDGWGKGLRYPNAMFKNGFWWVWEITNGEVKMKNASALNFTHWQPQPVGPKTDVEKNHE